MKKILLVFLLGSSLCVSAQDEQIKTYLKQIAVIADYIVWLNKGIKIARTGLNTISGIRNGELQLHDIFFKGLSNVNPRIKNWARLGDIISCQVNIAKSYAASYKQIKASRQFTDAEVKYIHSVLDKLLKDCSALLTMLTDLISNDGFKMSDDERIKRIDVVYANMQSNYRFCQKFSNNTAVMAMQRLKEKQEADVSRRLYDIK